MSGRDIIDRLNSWPLDEFEGRLADDIHAAMEEIRDLRSSVVAFAGPWAATYARLHGLPPGHLHPVHYDILARAGARMDDFKRVECAP